MRWPTVAILGVLSCAVAASEQPYRPPRLDDGQPESNFLRRDEPVLEYACHETNYSLIHILEGARVRDGASQ